MTQKKKKIYYFDHAATTPVDKRVLKKMLPFFSEDYGNPANLYGLGRGANYAVKEALEKICGAINCSLSEFVFTGSATESDNLALAGVARANKERGNKIIISNIEHKGILSIAEALKKEGFEIVELRVSNKGRVNPEDLSELIDEKTILVSVTSSDSETGTLQPIKEMAEIIKKFRIEKKTNLPYFHTDASQAAAHTKLDVDKLGVDLMTLSAHKLYGPKGIGGLYVRKGVSIKPIIYGGGQQSRLRSGTENVPAIVGFGEAMALVSKDMNKESARLKNLRDKLEKGIFKSITKVVLNGHPKIRLPNFLNISILDIEGEALLLHLDELGIIVNTGSACNSQSLEPSYVLAAMENPYEYIHGSLRFTFGRDSDMASVNYVLKKLPPIVKILRKISPLNLDPANKEKMSMPEAFVGNQTPHFLRKKK
jgi:cysteine desulfurase